ncbi:unnamed protein product, partial [Didymodactylos carnosus]
CTMRITNSSEDIRRFEWLQIRDNCPNIVKINPTAISIARSRNLELKVDSVPENHQALYSCSFPLQQYFQCFLELTDGSTVMTVPALLLNETYLVCDSFKITYDDIIGKQKYMFNVKWKECSECNYKVLEREGDFNVNVYKCRHLSESCGSCLLLEDYYNCIWCENEKLCLNPNLSNCEQNQVVSAVMGTCADPRILQIVPLYGPLNGQTPIKVYGTSLGQKMDDIHAILIYKNQTEYPCIIKSDFYIVSKAFVCLPSEKLPIGIYSLKQPRISAFYPILGPRSGGTVLSIEGKYLTVGSKIQIYIGTQECILLNEQYDNKDLFLNDTVLFKRSTIIDDEIIQCRTTKLLSSSHMDEILYHKPSKIIKRQALWTGTISIFIDNFTETYSNLTYSYIDDPIIYNLSRYASIESGGLSIFVYGKNLHAIQLPKIFLQYNNNSQFYSDHCIVNNSDVMVCYSPALNLSNLSMLSPSLSSITPTLTRSSSIVTELSSKKRALKDVDCVEFKFGFIMDDVEAVRNTSTFSEPFFLCPDPQIYPFSNDGIKIQYQYEYLTIDGSNLLNGLIVEDYQITVGNFLCNVTSVSEKQIVCLPPNRTMLKIRKRSNSKNEQATVTVKVGHRFYIVGVLAYQNIEKRSSILYYIVACICGIILTGFIIISYILFHQTNTKRTKQLNRLQNQIDTLEMRVARECKEAFAELQTDIGELTNDLCHSGVPFHDYRTFCMKILFPNATDEEEYMMLHNVELPLNTNRRNNVRQGLCLLEQLLHNKIFLLLLIRTLEADKIRFRLSDRLTFASIISILLQDKLEYFT